MGHPTAQSSVSEDAAAAVSRLFREHHRLLVAYLALRLRSAQEAKDVAQEAYVRLLELKRPDAPRLLRAYLFRTAANLAIDRLRHRTVHRSAAPGELSAQSTGTDAIGADPAEQLAARERAEQLIGFLQELSVQCRQVFDLHRLQGIAQREVGTRLGISERMVRRYVTYAMVYCRLRLNGMPAEQAREEIKL
jgi:RNA polymerase sigma factor (sigma-70 family)